MKSAMVIGRTLLQRILFLAGILLVAACAPTPNTNGDASSSALLGGDRDEHGCIPSAGYQWCEAKQKCLRIWEENCHANLQQELQYLLAAKYDKSPNDVVVTISKQSAEHAAGSVKFSKDPDSPGGLFLAAKKDNVWRLVYDGNGSVDCEQLRTEYRFPNDMLAPNFCD